MERVVGPKIGIEQSFHYFYFHLATVLFQSNVGPYGVLQEDWMFRNFVFFNILVTLQSEKHGMHCSQPFWVNASQTTFNYSYISELKFRQISCLWTFIFEFLQMMNLNLGPIFD